MKSWIIKKKNEGFTIMETLVAIFIILLAITGPMVFAQNGLRAAFIARDQVTAFYLAQDAIEYIKNVKDDNGLSILGGNNTNWLSDLSACELPGANSGCTIDTINETVESCNSSNKPGCFGSVPDGSEDNTLNSTSDGFFVTNTPSGYTKSIFARQIEINELVSDKEAEVIVRIRWRTNESVGYREITVQENITNWIGALAGEN